MPAIDHPAFKVHSVGGNLRVSLIKDGATLSVDFDTKDAAILASLILGGARDAYDQTGRPSPGKDDVSGAATTPSGYGIGLGDRSNTVSLLFYFGDSVLGIQIPKAGLSTLSQRLALLGAEEGKPQ